MPFCKYCGAALPENASFCTKCGGRDPIERVEQVNRISEEKPQMPVPAASESVPPVAGKPLIAATRFKDNFTALFVILGVVSIVLLQFSTMIVFSAFGFGVTLAVLAIVCSVAFCATGAARFFNADNTKTLGKRHSTADVICLALGIICFVYVLVTSIIVLKTASDLIDAMELFIAAMMT